MLKGISPLISPDLLYILAMMGHGDELVFADAHFPGHRLNSRIIRADGQLVPDLLAAVLDLVEPDSYEPPFIMMSEVAGDQLDPEVESAYLAAIHNAGYQALCIHRIDRYSFYERAQNAFAVVMTGETRKYGNLILKKGVTPC